MRNHKSQRQREFHQGKGDQEQQAQQGAGRMKTGGTYFGYPGDLKESHFRNNLEQNDREGKMGGKVKTMHGIIA